MRTGRGADACGAARTFTDWADATVASAVNHNVICADFLATFMVSNLS
jgi:hypothetical protein